jgi:hypothetical protein
MIGDINDVEDDGIMLSLMLLSGTAIACADGRRLQGHH